MMFREVAVMMYRYIVEIEVLFLMRFKMDPFSLMRHLTLMELQQYIQIMEARFKEDKKNIDSKKLTKQLLALRDILNLMFWEKDTKH